MDNRGEIVFLPSYIIVLNNSIKLRVTNNIKTYQINLIQVSPNQSTIFLCFSWVSTSKTQIGNLEKLVGFPP